MQFIKGCILLFTCILMSLTIVTAKTDTMREYPIVLKCDRHEVDCMDKKGRKPEGDPMLLTVKSGKSLKFKVSGTKKEITWKSSNNKIATVNKKGKVKAKKAGTCMVYAKVKGIRSRLCVYIEVE